MGSVSTLPSSVLPSSKGLNVTPSMRKGGRGERSINRLQWLQETTEPPPTVLAKGPRSGMSKGPSQWNTGVDLIASPDLGEM